MIPYFSQYWPRQEQSEIYDWIHHEHFEDLLREIPWSFEGSFPLEDETSSVYHENEKQVNKTQQNKKALSSKTSNTTTNLDFDFSDEGFPLALFQTGGEEMRNDYEINKRKRKIKLNA